jgi:hypothetical protein
VFRILFCVIHSEMTPCLGHYFDVKLKTRKSAQTGVLHSWRLFTNDIDSKIFPMWMMILLVRLYPTNIGLKGPLFLKVSKQGAILPEPMVSAILFIYCPGLCMAPIPSIAEAANTRSKTKAGLLQWWPCGVVGLRWRPSQCSGTFILLTTQPI